MYICNNIYIKKVTKGQLLNDLLKKVHCLNNLL